MLDECEDEFYEKNTIVFSDNYSNHRIIDHNRLR